MLPIDHIPIGHADLDRLAAQFERLGFTVSGPCAYRSPDPPGEAWSCRAVFLGQGWLDLQSQPAWPAELGATPHSCLFRTARLEEGLLGFRTGEVFRLSRHWAQRQAPVVRLAWRSLLERVAPFALALVSYPEDDPDQASPPDHANTATRLLGLAFGGADPGPAAGQVAERLDLSGFRFLAASDFGEKFGRPEGPWRAVRIEVRDLEAAASALRAGGLGFTRGGQSLFVPVQSDLGCGLEFEAEA